MVPNIDSRIVTDILSEPCRASLYHRLFVYWHVLNKSPSFCPSQTQSFAIANAKLCNRQRKALQPPTQSFAFAYAKLCIRQCKRFWGKARYIYNLFTHFSLHVIAATKGKISIYFFAVTYVFTIFASYWVCDWENTYY